MKKESKTFRSALLLVVLGIVMGILVMLVPRAFTSSSPAVITSTTLKNSLEKASDLISTKYNYGNVGQFSNSLEFNGWTIPFTEKNFLLTYQGQASLGVPMDEAEVQVEGSTIHILLPPVQVMSNTIDEDSIQVYNETSNLFNPIRVSDYAKFAVQQKKVIEEKLQSQGTFKKAQEDTKTAILSLLNMIPEVEDHYTIDIEFRQSPNSVHATAPETAPDSTEQEQDSPEQNSQSDTTDANESDASETPQSDSSD